MMQTQMIRRRNPDGTLGDYKPVFDAPVASEVLAALEAVAMLDIQNAELQGTVQHQKELLVSLTQEVEKLKSDVAALKGGGQT